MCALMAWRADPHRHPKTAHQYQCGRGMVRPILRPALGPRQQAKPSGQQHFALRPQQALPSVTLCAQASDTLRVVWKAAPPWWSTYAMRVAGVTDDGQVPSA